MQLVDTHCHIHDTQYGFNTDEVFAEAKKDGITKIICVGTGVKDSQNAIEFACGHNNCFASIGIHPHDGKEYVGNKNELKKFTNLATEPKVVAVGECGLDYFYNHSSKADQQELLHFQLDLAKKHELPMIFHVREAFNDFWQIFDQYHGIKGVMHSFTASRKVMDEVLKRNLYMGLNGIMTFTKDDEQLAMAKVLPLDKMLLETDAPFLTPVPYRGTICQPKHIRVIAEFLANLIGEDLGELALKTSQNAHNLFNLS